MTQLASVTIEVRGVRLAHLLVRLACPAIKAAKRVSPKTAESIACFVMSAIPKLIRTRAI